MTAYYVGINIDLEMNMGWTQFICRFWPYTFTLINKLYARVTAHLKIKKLELTNSISWGSSNHMIWLIRPLHVPRATLRKKPIHVIGGYACTNSCLSKQHLLSTPKECLHTSWLPVPFFHVVDPIAWEWT